MLRERRQAAIPVSSASVGVGIWECYLNKNCLTGEKRRDGHAPAAVNGAVAIILRDGLRGEFGKGIHRKGVQAGLKTLMIGGKKNRPPGGHDPQDLAQKTFMIMVDVKGLPFFFIPEK